MPRSRYSRLVHAASFLVLAALMPGTAVAAEGDVQVTLSIRLRALPVPHHQCDVSVAQGGTGLAVLDAAVAQGCIDSYKAAISFGLLDIECINDMCEERQDVDRVSVFERWFSTVPRYYAAFDGSAVEASWRVAGCVLVMPNSYLCGS